MVRGEGIAAQKQRKHKIGLFDDLLAIQIEVRDVQQQRVLLGRGRAEVPWEVLGEPLRLRVDLEGVVVRDEHRRGGVPPARRILGPRPQLGGRSGVAVSGRSVVAVMVSRCPLWISLPAHRWS